MRNLNITFKIIVILLLPLGLLLMYSSSFYPQIVERIYSQNIYKIISQNINYITGSIPFSLAESIVVFSIFLLIYMIFKTIMLIIKKPIEIKKNIYNFIINIFGLSGIIYFAFVMLWGLNYKRLPFANISGLDVRPASVKELEEVCSYIIENANKIREYVYEDKNGVMYIPGGYRNVFIRASKGYVKASIVYPELGGSYGIPKSVFMSSIMSYAGISGIYFPFTGEANVNVKIPDSMLPCTAAHEMAHQRGFAREDEANFISYLTCSVHPDTDFQYSGMLLALIHSMNTLSNYDEVKYFELRKKYSDGVRKDLNAINYFWKKYEGPMERISNKINDTYLKSNGQSDGVMSYGRMVDLLIAEYRNKIKK